MLEQLRTRGEAAGRARAAAVAERLGERVREALPDVTVTIDEGGITLSGRGLWRRWLAAPGLRWLGGLLR